MSRIEPCVDCKWRMLILRGKPTVALYCTRCIRWFISSQVHVVGEDEVEAFTDGVNDHVNGLLRCDGMAPHVIVKHIRGCQQCAPHASRVVILDSSRENRFDVYIAELAKKGEGAYMAAALPAYTLQHRCGADPHLRELYSKIRPDAKAKVEKYAEKRLGEQERFKKRHPV